MGRANKQPANRSRRQSLPDQPEQTPTPNRPTRQSAPPPLQSLRIIGGQFRGRTLQYSGDLRTRPMKDDVREATFNLVGGFLADKVVIDLFAGTGAVGLEAISRGAHSAILIERHFPTAALIEANAKSLGSDLPVQVVRSDTFFWSRQFFKSPSNWPSLPWVVFCCPPYAFYQDKTAEMLDLIGAFCRSAPTDSLIVVESDVDFDVNQLPDPAHWRSKQYPPAQISVWR